VPLLTVLGVVLGVVTPIEFGFCAATLAASVSLAAVAGPRLRRALAAIALAAASAAYGASARDRTLDSALVAALDPLLDDRFAPPVWLAGRVADDAAVSGDSVVVAIDVTRVKAASNWRAVSGRATVAIGGESAAASVESWTRGRTFAAPVLVRRPQVWRNFGGPSDRWQRLRRASDVTGTVKSAALVEIGRGSALSEAGAAIRRFVRREIDRTVGPISRESAAVVVAILIGDRTSLDPAAIRDLQRAGTYHVIAISGGNIAIVVIACVFGLRLACRSRRIVALVTLAVVLAYGAVVGDQASVERAVAAAAVVLGLQAAGWSAPAWRIFILAATTVVVFDPMTVIDAGAWLSFGATLGILLLARPIAARLRKADARGGRVAESVVTLFAATIAAELALMPVSAAVFSQVSVAGLFLNFIAIPAMAAVQLSGIAAVALSTIAPGAALAAAHVAHAGVLAILDSASLLTIAPWLSWQTPPVSPMWLLAYYGAAMLAFVARRRVRAVCGGVAALALGVIVASPLLPARRNLAAGWLRVTFLDVGQGDGIVVQFPEGQSLLVDAGGSATGFDVGTRVVRPALWALGIRRLDWLAVTHGDIDHAGGASSIVNELEPREVWEGVPVLRNATMQRLRTSAQLHGGAWMRLVAGQSLEVGSASIEVLNPPAPDWERPATRNDDSIVLRLDFGDVSVMLTGDIGAAVERNLALATRPRLRLLKAPHHGSRTSSSPALVREWLPQAVIVSVGRGNTFGHPAPDVLARYAQFGVDVFRTDRDGAIAIETDGREVRLRTATGRSWRLTAVGR
jgi:competence protein ComEC